MRVIDYSIRVSGWFIQNPGDTREMRVSWKVWLAANQVLDHQRGLSAIVSDVT